MAGRLVPYMPERLGITEERLWGRCEKVARFLDFHPMPCFLAEPHRFGPEKRQLRSLVNCEVHVMGRFGGGNREIAPFFRRGPAACIAVNGMATALFRAGGLVDGMMTRLIPVQPIVFKESPTGLVLCVRFTMTPIGDSFDAGTPWEGRAPADIGSRRARRTGRAIGAASWRSF